MDKSLKVLLAAMAVGLTAFAEGDLSFRRNPELPFSIGTDASGSNRFEGEIADLQLVFGDQVFHSGPAKTGERLAKKPTAADVEMPMRFTCRFTTKNAKKSQRLLDNVHPGMGDGTLIDIYQGRLRIDLGGGVPGFYHPALIPTGCEVAVGVEITQDGKLFMSVNGDRRAINPQSSGFNIPPYTFSADEDGSKDGVLSWKFPMGESCHEGLAFSDGVTGVLAFGAGSTLNLTVGRADLWDHRGGYHWTDAQSYTNIVDAIEKGDKARLLGLFKKDTPPGEPRNPFMLPLGRIVLDLPGAELKSGKLDTRTGLGTIDFLHNGKLKRAELAMSKSTHNFAIQLPEDVVFTARAVPSMDQPAVKHALTPLGFKRPDVTDAGFTWQLPADESVTLAFAKQGRELALATSRGTAKPAPAAKFAEVRDGSVAHWRAFWARSARVKVPDPVIQGLFDYGMYRFGGMTDPDGVPCGLQGPWLEDNYIAPWSGDYHFNINVQECYSPAYRGGHTANLMPLFRMILSWRETLRENARKFAGVDGYVLPHSVSDRGINIGGFWTGTIDHASTAWVAQMMFDYVKYSGDVEFLRRDAYDFMKGAMAVYRRMMVEDNGKLALPTGPSPEFGGDTFETAVGRNPSFQLAAAHRLARNLIAAAKLLGEQPDPMWLDVEKRLPLATIDDARGGIMLFENRPFPVSHRHHSHLAGFYPFDVFDPEDAATAATMRTSFKHWRRKGVSQWTGWCVPWASVLCTHMGEAESAAGLLRAFEEYFTNPGHSPRCYPWKAGFVQLGNPRVGPDGRPMGQEILDMDGLISSATAIMEMMVHERNGKEVFFSGCPESWKDVSFENIALADGRRVSGRRINGKVELQFSK